MRYVPGMGDGYALTLSADEIQRYTMMAELARAAESELWDIAGLTTGAVVADVGCGPGGMFPALVSAIGPSGRLVGVDGTASTAAAAQALVDANGWTNVTTQTGQATDTGLEPGTFDVVMMRHVLAHNGPIEQEIVSHLATLLRPGGCVYLVDIDGTALRFLPYDEDADDLNNAYLRFHAARGNDLMVGLRLRDLVTTAGLEPVEYRGWYNIVNPPPGVRPPSWAARDEMVAAGIATADDLPRWDAALDRVGAKNPTIFASLFGVVGRRPA